MTLSYGVFYTLVTICSVAVVSLLFFFMYKWLNKQSEQVVSVIGSLILGAGVLSFYLLKDCNNPVIEVRGFDSEEYLLVLGSSFTASDDQEVNLENGAGGTVVINITDQTMYVERIEYSLGGIGIFGDDAIEEVPAHSFTVLNKPPDFYPWDDTPSEISVSGNALYAKKIWVHY